MSSSGAAANLDVNDPAISGDGRFVAFRSSATTLVAGDTLYCGVYNCADIFVRDRQNQTTVRVSIDNFGNQANGHSYYPALSASGRFVAFTSLASNLVPGDTNHACDYDFDAIYDENCADVFVHDRDVDGDAIYDEAGAISTARVSVGPAGLQADDESIFSSFSADGRFVGFYSESRNLVANDTNNVPDSFLHDRQTQTTERVSVNSAGVAGNSRSGDPAVSADGRYVAFSSLANNLASGDNNSRSDVFVRDRQLGVTERVSLASDGAEGNNDSGYCCESVGISGDGRYVAFESYATNLVSGDTSFVQDIFVRDRTAGATVRVTVSSAGAEANDFSYYPVISGNGRHVAFQSYADNLAPDGNFASDVFVHDLADADGDGTWDAIDANDDNDMLSDNTEAFCNSNPLLAGSLPERVDTPGDDNGDTLVNEVLPAGSGEHDCDGDGYSGAAEAHVFAGGSGNGDQDPCGTTAGRRTWHQQLQARTGSH